MAGKPLPWNVPVDARYGAPMGRPNVGVPHDQYVKLHSRMVRKDDYDGGGAYWGRNERGSILFCAWSGDRSIIRYGWAPTALQFEEMVREDWPQADFL